MALNQSLISSERQNWETPQDLFEKLDQEFKFDLDAMADKSNSKKDVFFSKEQDSLKQDWAAYNSIFCNPPYKTKIQNEVIKKAHETNKEHGNTIVLLIPARTDTKRWHEYIFGKAEIRFLQGRLRFEVNGVPCENPAPFPSAIVIFKGKERLQ